MVVGKPRDEREEPTLGILPSERMAVKCKMSLNFTNKYSITICYQSLHFLDEEVPEFELKRYK